MRTFNGDKTINTKNIRLKVCVEGNSKKLEACVNQWFESNNVEIVSIEYTADGSNIRAFILYRIGPLAQVVRADHS